MYNNTGFNPNQQQQPQYAYGGQPMQQPQFQQPQVNMVPGQYPQQQIGQVPMQGQMMQAPMGQMGQFQPPPPNAGQFQPQQSVASFQQQPMLAQPAMQQPQVGYGGQPQVSYGGQPQVGQMPQQQYNVGQSQMSAQQLQQFAQQQAAAIASQQAHAQHQAFAAQNQQFGNPQQQNVAAQQFQQIQQLQHTQQQTQQELNEMKQQDAVKKAEKKGQATGARRAAKALQDRAAAEEQQRAARRATVHDQPNFDAAAAAQGLRKAMKGLGCDKKAVAEIIGSCSNRQRQEIIHVYPQQPKSEGRDLIKDLKSELRGNLEMLVKSLMRTPASYDASELRKAMKGIGCDEEILIEILCTRTYSHLEQVKAEYRREYDRDLVADVLSETAKLGRKDRLSDLFKEILSKPREADELENTAKVDLDVQALLRAGEDRSWTVHQETFTEIFTKRSYSHLDLVFKKYQNACNNDIRKTIKRKLGTSHYAQSLQAIVGCVRGLDYFFAKKLKQAMKGVGTTERTLVRVVVSRSEIDLADIKDEFAKRDDVGKGQTLAKWIKDDVGGEFERLLLKVIDAK